MLLDLTKSNKLNPPTKKSECLLNNIQIFFNIYFTYNEIKLVTVIIPCYAQLNIWQFGLHYLQLLYEYYQLLQTYETDFH
jgi:hypothetical protein